MIADISRLRYSGRRAQNANGSYFRLGDLLDEVNISRPITSTHNRHLTPLRMCEDFEQNLVLWLCKYLPADQDLQSLLGDVSSKNPFALESWAKDLVRTILASGLDQCAFREVTDPYTGNTLLHYALLFDQYYRQRSREFELRSSTVCLRVMPASAC